MASAILLLSICAIGPAKAIDTGHYRDYWQTRCAITAQVKGVTTSGQWVVKLHPIASLAGAFDPSLHSEVQASVVKGPFGSAILALPTVGTYVIVVMDVDGANFRVVPAALLYMPSRLGITELRGPGDPIVEKTAEALQDLRSHETEYPWSQGALERMREADEEKAHH